MYSFTQAAMNFKKRPSIKPKETRSEKPLTTSTPAIVEDLASLDNMNLKDFGQGKTVLTIRSEILEDVFLLVPDNYVKRPGDPVTYTVKEVEAFLTLPVDLIKAAHSLKKKIKEGL